MRGAIGASAKVKRWDAGSAEGGDDAMVPAENEFLSGGALNCELITSLCGRSWRSDHGEAIMPSWCK